MTASESLADTLRSSPRSQRRKTHANPPVETPNRNTSAEETRTPHRRSQLSNGTSEQATPASSRKRPKTEALVVREELQGTADNGSPQKSRQRKKTRREEVQEGIPEDGQGEVQKSPKKIVRKHTVKEEEVELQADGDSPRKAKRKRNTETEEAKVEGSGTSPKKIKRRIAELEGEAVDGEPTPGKTQRKKKVKQEEFEEEEGEEDRKQIKRKRKTKEEKEAEAMPLASRTNGLQMFIGAHVSCAKGQSETLASVLSLPDWMELIFLRITGVHNTVTNCVHIGGNAFAMFLKSQRKWENPPLQDDHRDQFIAFCKDHKYDAASHVLPHGSYLVNLAQEEAEKAAQGYCAFLDDLHRCEALGIKLYNFHPGSTGSHPRPSAIARIANALNRAHLTTRTVTTVLETMATGGNIIGSTFEDLRDIIAQVEDKTRIGVCLDTCHVFAAGYDLRTPTAFRKTFDEFDKIIGMKYLRALHLNDSKAPFGSHRDLHQNIGLGFLGLRAFHNVMNEPRLEGLPMVLETPIDRKDPETGKDVEDKSIWAKEIKMLEGLIGMDAEGDEFKALEKELADQGAEERKKQQEVFERKLEKDRKALEKGQTKLSFGAKKKKKVKGEISEGSGSELSEGL